MVHHQRHQSEGSVSHDTNDESDYNDHEARSVNTRSKTGSGANSKKKPSTSRRPSHQEESTKDAHHHDDPADPQNARKMQNRLAQREFRARRLEHIKELEARVEFLSKPQSEQTEILVAIIHGLMDENKQLRGSLKTMANFVSSGLGGFSHAIQLPEYDNALDLVNRGDRALLLKLVQEKGGSVSSTTGTIHSEPSSNHNANPSTAGHRTSPSPSAPGVAHVDKKRKSESSHDSHAVENSNRPANAKAPRTRSQNARNRQESNAQNTTASSEWQQNTPRDTPPISSATSPVTKSAKQDNQTQATSGQPIDNDSGDVPNLSVTSQQYPSAAGVATGSRMMDMFPNLSGGLGPLGSFDIFGSSNSGQNSSGFISNSSSAFGPGASRSGSAMDVKQEDSPPPPQTFQDPASAWMNAYTNLTPIGGNESFWSLTSSSIAIQGGMGQNIQQQQQQTGIMASTNQQNGKSSTASYGSNWNLPGQILSSNVLGSFGAPQSNSMMHQQHHQQQPLHGQRPE